MTVEMFFRQVWDDFRFQRNNSRMIFGDKEIIEKIWVPDTFFSNEHNSLTKESGVQIYEDGKVLWSQRMQVTFTANGDYRNFPFDSQIFPLKMESFKYKKSDVHYGWLKEGNSVHFASDLDIADLSFPPVHPVQYIRCIKLYTGEYCRVMIKIQVDRISGFYFSILFTPLFLTTILSFSTLWINSNHSLLFILLINLFTIIFKIWFRVTMLPPVGYSVCAVEYIDMCLAITLLVLLDNFIMSLMESPNNPTTSTGIMEFENLNLTEDSNIQVSPQNSPYFGQRCCGIYFNLNRIHDVCKYFIPTLFIVFQICFWLRVTFQEPIEINKTSMN